MHLDNRSLAVGKSETDLRTGGAKLRYNLGNMAHFSIDAAQKFSSGRCVEE